MLAKCSSLYWSSAFTDWPFLTVLPSFLPHNLFCHLLYEAFFYFLPVEWDLFPWIPRNRCAFSWKFFWSCLLLPVSHWAVNSVGQYSSFSFLVLETPEYSSSHVMGMKQTFKKITHYVFLDEDVKTSLFFHGMSSSYHFTVPPL